MEVTKPEQINQHSTIMASGTPPQALSELKTKLVIIGQHNLQNSILLGYLSQNTHFDAELINPVKIDDAKMPAADFFMVDCNSVRYERAHDMLDSFDRPNSFSFLINCETDSMYEQLMQWPSLHGIFYRHTSHELMIQGIECVRKGGLWFRRELLENYLRTHRSRPKRISDLVKNLTKRERQILVLTAVGASNQDIAGKLEVSTHTVKTHIYNLFKKIGVHNRIQAITWAKENLPLLEDSLG